MTLQLRNLRIGLAKFGSLDENLIKMIKLKFVSMVKKKLCQHLKFMSICTTNILWGALV